MRKVNEFVIYRVKAEDIYDFLSRYEREILLESNSLMELLILFEQEYLLSLDYLRN